MVNIPVKFARRSQLIFTVIVIAAIYYLSGLLGIKLALPKTNVTPIWPPSGIALASMLLFGWPSLFGIFLGSSLLNFYTLTSLGYSPTTALPELAASCGVGLGAVLQAAFGAFIIQETIPNRNYFSSGSSVLIFLALSMLSCLINSNIGLISMTLGGFIPPHTFLTAWLTWWIGDTVGIFIVTPLILSWMTISTKHVSFLRILEAILLFCAIIATTYLNRYNGQYFFLFLIWLIWAALRFNLAGSTAALFITTIAVVSETVKHRGPFALQSLNDSLLALELFIMIITPTVLSLAAELNKRNQPIKIWGNKGKFNQMWLKIKNLFNRSRKS